MFCYSGWDSFEIFFLKLPQEFHPDDKGNKKKIEGILMSPLRTIFRLNTEFPCFRGMGC